MTRRATEAGEPAINVTFRAYRENCEAWDELAEADGLTRSAWITRVLNAEVERRRGKRSK